MLVRFRLQQCTTSKVFRWYSQPAREEAAALSLGGTMALDIACARSSEVAGVVRCPRAREPSNDETAEGVLNRRYYQSMSWMFMSAARSTGSDAATIDLISRNAARNSWWIRRRSCAE